MTRPHSTIGALLLAAGAAAQTTPPEPPAATGPDAAPPDVSTTKKLPSVDERTAGLERREGLLTMHLDREGGTVWLELPPPAGPDGEVGRYLYVESLRTGLGSNPIGLDRGQLGNDRVVRLRRLGPRVLIEQLNLRFRARSDDPLERRAVEESFATSVLWGAEIAALDPDGRALVDLGPFVVRDAHGTRATLKRSGEGTYAFDRSRSALLPDDCLVFPDNVELEAVVTFTSDEPGRRVRDTAPTGDAVTLVQHHSIIRLPDDGYRPRRFDPRAPSNAITFVDYAAPLDHPRETRWITRHRLEKTDPAAPRSRVREPIVYYVDRGAPEPVRSALIEGASWWAEAFERAGFIDAYRVELMPEGAHPLDVRYNVIQWVHRSTRGWSYGGSITDPRTGEIIKGHVTLGSLRVRQDRMIFEGLAGAGPTGGGGPDDPIELSLARLRQLSAHEVGHTLGFAHNFAASTYGGRASVMDYPAPLVTVTAAGDLDFSRAYAAGIGIWDIHAVRYAYTQPAPDTDEERLLESIVREGQEQGLLFVSDRDARPAGSAHPMAHLWDNGADPIAALRGTMAVRRVAMDRFGTRNLAAGRPLALLHEVYVPVYLYHRYQVEAASKLVGGVDYRYAVRGDGDGRARPLDGARQRAALAELMRCLEPAALHIPDATIELLVPQPFGYGDSRELMTGATAPTFDAAAAASVAADLVISLLLERHRTARLTRQHAREPSLPGLEEVIDALVVGVLGVPDDEPPRLRAVRRGTQQVLIERMIAVAADPAVDPAVRATLDHRLSGLGRELGGMDRATSAETAHLAALARQIRRHLERQVSGPRDAQRIETAPPGSPIGSIGPDWGGCCGERAPATRLRDTGPRRE